MFGMYVYTAPESLGVFNHPAQSVEPPCDNIYTIEQDQRLKRQGEGRRSLLVDKIRQFWKASQTSEDSKLVHTTKHSPWFSFQQGFFSRFSNVGHTKRNLAELSQDLSSHLQEPTPSIRINLFGDEESGEDTLTRYFNKSQTLLNHELCKKGEPKIMEVIESPAAVDRVDKHNFSFSEPVDLPFRNDDGIPRTAPVSNDPYPKQFDPTTVDFSHLAVIQDPIYRKNVNLQLIKKRINTIASKRNDMLKAEKKLLRDLKTWEKNPYLSETVTPNLVEDVCTMFTQDLEFEQRLAQALKQLADTLGIVSKRESELITAKKDLNNTFLKYNKVKEKKNENEGEVQLLKEKVITLQQSLEVIQFHYDQSVSVYARKQFNNYGIELYETCSDLREHAEAFVKKSFRELEKTDADCFTEDLENLRRRRAQQYWSTLAPEERRNPIKWENLKSGIYEQEDPLLKAIYKTLPDGYSSNTILQGNPFNNDTILENFGGVEDSYLDRSNLEIQENEIEKLTENTEERTITGVNDIGSVKKDDNNNNTHFDETMKESQKKELTEIKLNTDSWRKDDTLTRSKTVRSPILKDRFDSAKETLEENAWSTVVNKKIGNNENES